MLRRIIAALILVPLAIVLIAFAVANRQDVTVSFDPFSSVAPALQRNHAAAVCADHHDAHRRRSNHRRQRSGSGMDGGAGPAQLRLRQREATAANCAPRLLRRCRQVTPSRASCPANKIPPPRLRLKPPAQQFFTNGVSMLYEAKARLAPMNVPDINRSILRMHIATIEALETSDQGLGLLPRSGVEHVFDDNAVDFLAEKRAGLDLWEPHAVSKSNSPTSLVDRWVSCS